MSKKIYENKIKIGFYNYFKKNNKDFKCKINFKKIEERIKELKKIAFK